jgi:RNA polymerase sigma-70 factor (sigma-E family)
VAGNGLWRSLVSALRSGRRGPRFKSGQPDQFSPVQGSSIAFLEPWKRSLPASPMAAGNLLDAQGVCNGVGEGAAFVCGLPSAHAATKVDMTDRRLDAVAGLFDQHYAGLCRLAFLLLDDRATAEEAVQDAFVRTFAGWHRLRHPERAHAYLRAAVVNQCRSRGRRRLREQRGNRRLWEAAPEGVWDTEGSADSMAVLDAVRALPPRQREAVVLRYYEDLPESDVAAALGCSLGTAKSQLAKARASLARRLGESGGAAVVVHGSDEGDGGAWGH